MALKSCRPIEYGFIIMLSFNILCKYNDFRLIINHHPDTHPRHLLCRNRLPSLRETGSTNLTTHAEVLPKEVQINIILVSVYSI